MEIEEGIIEEGRKIRGEGKPYIRYIKEMIEDGAF